MFFVVIEVLPNLSPPFPTYFHIFFHKYLPASPQTCPPCRSLQLILWHLSIGYSVLFEVRIFWSDSSGLPVPCWLSNHLSNEKGTSLILRNFKRNSINLQKEDIMILKCFYWLCFYDLHNIYNSYVLSFLHEPIWLGLHFYLCVYECARGVCLCVSVCRLVYVYVVSIPEGVVWGVWARGRQWVFPFIIL